MWKLAGLALWMTSSAAASPGPATAACDLHGPTLVEVDRAKDGTHEHQITKILEAGGWTASDRKPDELSGCVPDADLERLRGELAKATWNVTKARFHCDAMSPVHTDYTVKGKLVWTAKLCSGESLDKDSAAAIADLDQLVKKLAPQRTPLQ